MTQSNAVGQTLGPGTRRWANRMRAAIALAALLLGALASPSRAQEDEEAEPAPIETAVGRLVEQLDNHDRVRILVPKAWKRRPLAAAPDIAIEASGRLVDTAGILYVRPVTDAKRPGLACGRMQAVIGREIDGSQRHGKGFSESCVLAPEGMGGGSTRMLQWVRVVEKDGNLYSAMLLVNRSSEDTFDRNLKLVQTIL